nr:hypothetical protein [Deltaproteobacteria bacterium]
MAATYEQRSDAHFVGSRLGDDEVIPRGVGQMVTHQLFRPAECGLPISSSGPPEAGLFTMSSKFKREKNPVRLTAIKPGIVIVSSERQHVNGAEAVVITRFLSRPFLFP